MRTSTQPAPPEVSAAPVTSLEPWHGWTPLLLLPAAVLLLTPPDWARWVFMWLLAFAVYAGCKWLTWRRTPVAGVPWWRHVGYLLAWPGMDASAFLRSEPRTERPPTRQWAGAAAKMLAGIALFWGAARFVPADQEIVLGWLGMLGVVLMLHFGLFELLSCAWRTIGVAAHPLMHRPLAPVRLSDFWGRRWNTAFRDLTHRFLFRPLTEHLGARWGVAAGFVFSGLVHDLIISVSAGGGYGGPTLYFGLQAAALLGERSHFGQALGLGRGWRGWLFTMLALALPVWLLFHAPFVREVVVPFMRALGAA